MDGYELGFSGAAAYLWDEEVDAERCGLVVEEALEFCYLLP